MDTQDAAESAARTRSREAPGRLATVYRVREGGRTLGYEVAEGESPCTTFDGGIARIPLASFRDGLARLPWLPLQRSGSPRQADALVLTRARAQLGREHAAARGRPKPRPEG